MDLTHPFLLAWGNFYVIVGSAGAALIAVQFVVITLLANRRRRPTADSISAFGTSTVVHLTGALVLSALMSVPWLSLFAGSMALVMVSIGGIAYVSVVIYRARRQTDYQPVWDDWLWYVVLPGASYVSLALTAVFLRTAQLALFGIGAVALSLLLIGIHNAWDTVTHLVIIGDRGSGEPPHSDNQSSGQQESASEPTP